MKTTSQLELGKYYKYVKTGEIVRLVTIDKSGFKKHSTVRLIVECEGTGIRRILRSPSLLVKP